MAAVVPDPKRIRAFASEREFEHWLARHHDQEPELFLRIYKKGSAVESITYAQALDVALCWGWIDGVKKSYDTESFLQRFSPRRQKSVWSQNNRDHVARLIAQKRMTEHGLKHVQAAKADGRWQAAYASGSKMTTPADFLSALEQNPRAHAAYLNLDKTNRYALDFRVATLKTAAGRQKRIAAFVHMLERGQVFHPRATK